MERVEREKIDVLFSTRDNAGDGSVGGGGTKEGKGRGQNKYFSVRHLGV